MRRLILGGAAAATLLAAWLAPDDEGVIVSPAAATPRPAYDGAAAGNHAVIAAQIAAAKAGGAYGSSVPAIPAGLQIQRRVADEDPGNPFSSQDWQAPSPLKPAAARAARDQQAGNARANAPDGPPALPFQFVGRFIDDGKAAYFLQLEDRNIVARVGEKAGDRYRLDAAEEGILTFTYLPLNLKQTLAVGETN